MEKKTTQKTRFPRSLSLSWPAWVQSDPAILQPTLRKSSTSAARMLLSGTLGPTLGAMNTRCTRYARGGRGEATDLLLPCRRPAWLSPGRALRRSHGDMAGPPAATGDNGRAHHPAHPRREGLEGAEGRWWRGWPEPSTDKAGTEEPATERLCTAGVRPPSAAGQSGLWRPQGGEETLSFFLG